MHIDRARKLKYGDRVRCPEDRGTPAFTGTVRSEDCATKHVSTNIYDVQFIWVEVSGAGGTKAVWPSNRLG